MKFRTVLLSNGKTATGFEVSPDVVEALGAGKRPAVMVTINGHHSYRSHVAPMGGQFLVPVAAQERTGAGIEAGDEIDVELTLDTEPRVVDVPEDLSAALELEPQAKAFFEGLSYSHKRRHVLVINEAKSPETRLRRIDKAVEMLREGKK